MHHRLSRCTGVEVLVLSLVALTACGDDDSPMVVPDSGIELDGGPTVPDAGPAVPDAGPPPPRTCAEVDTALLDAAEELEFTGADATLSGAYSVTDRIIFEGFGGTTTTIEPGTVFFMQPDSWVIFGRGPATVFAEGTEEAPILFCGVDPTVGSWHGVHLEGGTSSDSELRHVRIEHAGASDFTALDIYTDVLLDHVTVSGAAATGLRLQDADDASTDVRVEGAELAVRLAGASAINAFPPGDYTGNSRDLAEIEGEFAGVVTFRDRGIPYVQLAERITFDDVSGDGAHRVTFEAGVEYRFSQDSFMIIGWRNDAASIFVEGTEEDPVVFTSHREGDGAAPGDWRGLQLQGGTGSDSSLRHAVFRYGGIAPADTDGDCTGGSSGGEGCANVTISHNANIVIENTSFESSAGYGVFFGALNRTTLAVNGDSDVITAIAGSGNTFTDNAAGTAFLAIGP